jgi:hypothetical protein
MHYSNYARGIKRVGGQSAAFVLSGHPLVGAYKIANNVSPEDLALLGELWP